MSDCNFTECEWRAKGRKLQQRIDELEDERNAFEGSFIAATKRIAELEAEIIELRDECSNAEAIQPPPEQSDD